MQNLITEGPRTVRPALAVLIAFTLLALATLPANQVRAQEELPPLPDWMNLCSNEFVSFVGRRWLPGSGAVDTGELLDELNFWTVQKRNIRSVRAFEHGGSLRAFVSVDLGMHRLANDGRQVAIVISYDGYRELMACLGGAD